MTEDRMEKLPKWAQREFNKLTAELRRYDELIKCDDKPSDTTFRPPLNLSFKNIPSGSTVRFHLADDDYIDVLVIDGIVRVYASKVLALLPRASNSIYMKIDGE
jgi:hypothetical protein